MGMGWEVMVVAKIVWHNFKTFQTLNWISNFGFFFWGALLQVSFVVADSVVGKSCLLLQRNLLRKASVQQTTEVTVLDVAVLGLRALLSQDGADCGFVARELNSGKQKKNAFVHVRQRSKANEVLRT